MSELLDSSEKIQEAPVLVIDKSKSKETEKEGKFSDMVKFEVKHTDKYTSAEKYLSDGQVLNVHKLVGERLEKKGAGKIIS